MPGADSGVGVGQLCGIHPLGLEVQPGGPFHPLLSQATHLGRPHGGQGLSPPLGRLCRDGQ